MILSLYTGASIGTCFGQAANINFMVSKAINFSFFVILDVSENLAFAIALHKVNNVSEFFDTDHKSVLVSVGLGKLLDACLISICRQANQNCFKDHLSAEFLVRLDIFEETRNNGDLNIMWRMLEKTIVQTANKVFSKIWYNFNCFVKIWLAIDEVETSKVNGMILADRSKYCKFKIAKDTTIRKTIDQCMEKFCSDKRRMIKSILECLFYKVVLDHLVVDDELVFKPDKVKLRINKIIEE
ncbi:hypothetical protein G9A89_001081 [Geosiphon pyriformis]|nr:hypothetical protein G9A89_001081 [Geosiphon pyriformis]